MITDRPIKIAMTGSSGFVGGNLTKRFRALGWTINPINKEDFKKGLGHIRDLLQGSEVVINLAGAPIIGRWTEEYKRVLVQSRVGTTKTLVDSLNSVDPKPEVFISTSAVGIYSDTGEHTESSFTFAQDFLGELARQWEAEALRAEGIGIRTVIFRFGIVLGANGGALQQMLPAFKLGLGGVIGSGKQAFSWIHIEDLINAYVRAISDKNFKGIYNLTAPTPTTNKGLTEALSSALKRPALFRIPEFALRLKYGDGAEVLTKGQRVLPERLLQSGFVFNFTDIKSAIEDIVKRS